MDTHRIERVEDDVIENAENGKRPQDHGDRRGDEQADDRPDRRTRRREEYRVSRASVGNRQVAIEVRREPPDERPQPRADREDRIDRRKQCAEGGVGGERAADVAGVKDE